ncbi:ABC transporter ATP-binding protein [Aquabacter spiritensis]|uniref:Amino acid/amide ABC transporter ATP-binding protein 1 (HAAT family) n=1 Tax=Aquabacter spiritensis TaxID=933073 RepID=A0A4R3LXA5_9HYPH|nr:ABC transporter ATP-binding protein [Aquabacter spiritensis]TCT05213.1 amino acid/amide ABC transporter ATP-binding protein 1 (HAAT family) [Aquabacter spiritensis]
MTAPLLQVRGLCKAYGALIVTDAVDLDVAHGEIHALIGPNGAGKTTFIALVAGEVAPDRGRILLGGADVTRHAVHRRAQAGLARSFQVTSVLPAFSAVENVALAVQAAARRSFRLLPAPGSDRVRRAHAVELLAQVGLAAKADVPAGVLSHGEKRALELAMALAGKPRLLLLDEPMAGAGPEEGRAMVELISAARAQCGILLVEHDMEAVFKLADRVSVLVAGRLLASGPPDAVRADPAVQAAYLGEAAT